MVVKVYVSGISGNKEVKKRQQRVLMILDSKNIKYEVVDIAEPGNEESKEFMQNNSKSLGATVSDPTPRSALPPQIFSDDDYCGDYDQFDLSNEVDEIEKFLKMAVPESVTSSAEVKLGNGEINSTTQEEKPQTAEEPPEAATEAAEKPTENETETKQNAEGDAQKDAPTEVAADTTTGAAAENETEPQEKLENGEVKEEAVSQPTDVEA